MEPRAHHILIGLFTLLTAAALMGFALWLNKAGADGEQVAYDIIFNEDVRGLSEGSQVLYTGIPVGQVVRLRLDPSDPSMVRTRIKVRKNTPVHESTTARMSLANITGASVIVLENEDPASPLVTSTDLHVPVIPTKPSPFNKLKTSGEELMVNITELVNNASHIFSSENNENLAKTLANLEQTTSAFAENKAAISKGIADIAESSAEFKKTLTQTNALVTRFNQQFEAHGSKLFVRADESLQSLQQLSTNLDNLMEENRESLAQGMHGLAEIGPVIKQLDDVIGNLNRITRQLAEDPSGYLLSGEQIKEYQP